MKARIGDELIEDKLGNSALVRSAVKRAYTVSDMRIVKRDVDVCYVIQKISNVKVEEPTIKEPTFYQIPLVDIVITTTMFGRLTDIAEKWNGKDK